MVVREPEGRGHTAAVARGVALCREWGATVMLTVPGDLPCLTADEVRRILDACGPAPAAVFVPSRSGLGTNAACLAPPDAVPLRFGEPSFADHLAAARARGIEPVILSLAGRRTRHRPAGGSRRAPAGGTPDAGRRRPSARPPPPPRRAPEIEVFGIRGMPELRPGDDLAALTLARRPRTRARRSRPATSSCSARRPSPRSRAGSCGSTTWSPSPLAIEVGHAHKKDPAADRDHPPRVAPHRANGSRILITETRHGLICANAGVDQSNVGLGWASLLPEDPDASARAFADRRAGGDGRRGRA